MRSLFDLKVTDWKGDPVVAEIGVALTDLAALSLGERNSATLLETFFSPQYRGVHTSSSLVNNGDEFTANFVEIHGDAGSNGRYVRLLLRWRWRRLRRAASASGRQEANLLIRPIGIRLWSLTSAGEVTFKVKLPDNLTTWRLDARALTKSIDGRLLVGENTSIWSARDRC